MIIGVDLGNKSRNCIAVMDSNYKIYEYSSLTYNDKETTPYEHRQKICKQIYEYIEKYKLTKNDWLLFEKISSFMHGYRSKLTNITSLAFIQATLINEFSDLISISEVAVVSWKAKVLNNMGGTKEDAIDYVKKYYPEINLDIIEHHKRKGDIIVKNHDLADAICIACYGNLVDKNKLVENIVNYN